jgi:glycosyltransferase involved in cell wall biosynthesis
MKVMQILPELNAGGVERGTLEVGKYLAQEGHESIVISNGGRLVAQLESEGSRHITLPVHKKSLVSLKQVKALRHIFKQEQPDIVHLRSRLPAWLAWLAWRKMDPRTRPRLITTVHGFNSVNYYSRIMTRGEVVICVSNSLKEFVMSNYPDVAEDRLVVIHRGISPDEFVYGAQAPGNWQDEWYETFPETRNKKLLTLPGRITRLKGHEDFLRVMKALDGQNYHGLIVGGAHAKKADYLEELKQHVEQMGLANRITFTGNRTDLHHVMSISDVVFSLTQQPESFGRTTLEALALGKPVIGYEHGGVGEILETLLPSGKVPVGDIRAIVDRLKEWEAHPAKPEHNNPFTLEKMLSTILDSYQSLLNKPR